MKKIIKKYSLIIALVLLIVIGAAAGISYAVFSTTASQTTTNTMSALNCLNITFTSNTDSVSLANTYPMTAAEGLATTPYNFTIKNNCSNYVEYYLLANVINNANNVNGSYVKVNLSGDATINNTVITSLTTTSTPSDLSNVLATYILNKSSLEDNESQTFNYQMWLDGDNASIWTDESVENKNYTVKLSVIGVVKTSPYLIIKLPASPVGVYSTTFTGASWNNKIASLEVSSIQTKGKNNINLTNTDTSSATNFASYIIGLAGSTQGTGQVVNENGYRYEGKNPNNYVSFNGELWRIIGVFDSASHGVAGSNLVKLIKETSLGGLAWNKSNTNDWPNSSMYHLLNDYYYNGTNESTVTYCYGYSTTVPANCDFTSNGITNVAYRNMIQNVTWYLGGTATNSQNTEAFYTAERGTTVYSGRSTTTTGNIGLMYMSDYGYGVLASSCARTTNMSSYNSSTCAGQNWLYGQGYEWTIVPSSSNSSSVWYVDSGGYAYNNYAYNGFAWRPVLYLKSDVKKIGGDGSILNPYAITM
jgi:hypothetical protein